MWVRHECCATGLYMLRYKHSLLLTKPQMSVLVSAVEQQNRKWLCCVWFNKELMEIKFSLGQLIKLMSLCTQIDLQQYDTHHLIPTGRRHPCARVWTDVFTGVSGPQQTQRWWEQSYEETENLQKYPHAYGLNTCSQTCTQIIMLEEETKVCDGILCVCVFVCLLGMYFFTIVQALVDWGYTRDDDVRGAPYDWRRAPSKQTLSEKMLITNYSLGLSHE